MIEQVKEYVLHRIKEYKESANDHYDFWEEHVKYVYKESIELAKKYNADIEIVSLGALLHDIALINKVGDRKDHHINGEIIAREVLESKNYDKAKMERVLKCVYNHRSSKNAETIEEICVADADILAHFDNLAMLFYSAFVRYGESLETINDWMKSALEKDYNDLSDQTKESYKERYNQIIDLIIKK